MTDKTTKSKPTSPICPSCGSHIMTCRLHIAAAPLMAFVADIVEMTNADDENSYMSDDPHACLEVIASKSRAALTAARGETT